MSSLKKILFTSIPIFSILLYLYGCVNLDKLVESQKIKVEPSTLELHGNSVDFKILATVPIDKIKKKYTYRLQIKYAPKNHEAIQIGEIEVAGNKPLDPELSSGKKFSFDYTDKLVSGDLVLEASIQKAGKDPKSYEAGYIRIAQGVITTSRLLQPTYFVHFIPSQYRDIEEYENKYAKFMFLQGKSNLRESEIEGEYGKQITSYVANKKSIHNINMIGMHSPEGHDTTNNRLAQERAEVVENFIKNLSKEYGYEKQIDNVSLQKRPVFQDWTEFRNNLREYTDISESEKNKIFNIIDDPTIGGFFSKELKLKKIPSYRKIYRDIYPGLRIARTEISFIKEKKSDAELIAAIRKILDKEEDSILNHQELNYAADLTPDLKEKEFIYILSLKEDDQFYTYNNLGATYLSVAKKTFNLTKRDSLIEKAIIQLELSIKKKESPEAYVNLAGAKLMKGDISGAINVTEKVSTSVSSLLESIQAIKGYIYIKEADYEKAIESLSRAGNDPIVLYNKGLAYLLKGSKERNKGMYEKAKIAFQEAIAADSNNAYAYYGSAIAAARMGDESQVTSNITKSSQLNEDLRSRAVSDLEFINYSGKEQFKAALK